MNHVGDILAYLVKVNEPAFMTLAPNAPPVVRTLRGISVAINKVLDAGDVMDTLRGLCERASMPASAEIPSAGSFSMSVPQVGRLRVNYATQRGSKVVTVQCVSFNIPAPGVVCRDEKVISHLASHLRFGGNGLLSLHGRSPLANGLLAYVLLNYINQTTRRMIFTVERTLMYLMAHGDSVAIQGEVSSDISSFAEGIGNARRLGCDLLFLGDVGLDDSLAGIVDVAQGGTSVVMTSTCFSATLLPRKLLKESGGLAAAYSGLSCLAAEVIPEPDGRINVTVRPAATIAAE
jgi:Tfp pilus assembly pilus retraction ATPase PilT